MLSAVATESPKVSSEPRNRPILQDAGAPALIGVEHQGMEVLTSRVLLRSRDPEALQHFYRYQLRLSVAREYPGGLVFHAGNGLIEVPGHMSSELTRVAEPAGALWLQVRDAAATERELRAAQVPIEREAVTEPWGLIELHLRDPDGRLIVVVEVPATHPLRLDNR